MSRAGVRAGVRRVAAEPGEFRFDVGQGSFQLCTMPRMRARRDFVLNADPVEFKRRPMTRRGLLLRCCLRDTLKAALLFGSVQLRFDVLRLPTTSHFFFRIRLA